MKKLAVSRKSLSRLEVEPQIKQVLKLLIELSPEMIYLFGSATSDSLTHLSDLDFMLVFSDPQKLRLAQKKLGPHYPLAQISVELVWVISEEFERKKNLGGVIFDAFNSGEVLYKKGKRDDK